MLTFMRTTLVAVTLLTSSSVTFAESGETSNICGKVLQSKSPSLNAADVYSCLTSTPFKPDVATELLDYWRGTLEFQSTLAYLRDPPSSYQQRPVDLIRGLDLIRTDIDNGVFRNQYSFETAVQDLLYAAHDTHVALIGSILGVFTFGAPFELATISIDGIAVPRIYMATDISTASYLPDWEPSPVVKINGDLTEDFLAVYASHNAFGSLEPHGDWNQIMFSAARTPLSSTDTWLQTIFYPGKDITLEFQNGTTYGPVPWQAYNIQAYGLTGINTGEDLYNYFVLGKAPSKSDSDQTATTTADAATATSTDDSDDDDGGFDLADLISGWGGAYPDEADVAPYDLGYGSVITGYFLTEHRIGVLSIPSFQLLGDSASTFSETIADFLKQSKEKGLTNIVIDLQQNTGGDQLLVTDTFRQFFPSIDPFSGMRTRSSELANEIGSTFSIFLQNNLTSLNETWRDALISDPFAVVAGELNADTNRNFSNWAEYYGPHADKNDQFSTIFRYNLSSAIFTEAAGDIEIYGYGSRTNKDPQPYDAKDIVLLTDGACASACDLFIEMMHHEAGVRTVVIGGLPQYGPMQARGGTRGALRYTSDALDGDFEFGAAINSTLAQILPNRTGSDAVQNSFITFNLADQIRPREYTPLQFVYEAADCRIFWTPETINNFTELWLYTANAAFFNASTCVAHSAEHRNTMATDLDGPSSEQKESWAKTNRAWRPKYNESMSSTANLAQLQYLLAGTHEASGGVGCTSLKHAKETLGLRCTPQDVALDCGNTNLYSCGKVNRCVLAGQSASIVPEPECRKRCDDYSPCPCEYSCVKGKAPDGRAFAASGWCEKIKTDGDRVCEAKLPKGGKKGPKVTAPAAQRISLHARAPTAMPVPGM